jgi:hypothetical protein
MHKLRVYCRRCANSRFVEVLRITDNGWTKYYGVFVCDNMENLLHVTGEEASHASDYAIIFSVHRIVVS